MVPAMALRRNNVLSHQLGSAATKIRPIISSKLLMCLRDRGALAWECNSGVRCVCVCVRANVLHPLDPDAVVADVEVVQDVCRLVLPEDSVDVQQALQDAGLPWRRDTPGEGCYFCAVLGLTAHLRPRSHCSAHKSDRIRGRTAALQRKLIHTLQTSSSDERQIYF